MRRLALLTAALVAGFATQALADHGPPVDFNVTTMDAEAMHFEGSGTVIASKPCRRARDLTIFTAGLGRRSFEQGTFHSTNRAGHFHGEIEWLYRGGNNDGDIPEEGGTLVVTLKAPKTRPQKDNLHAYHCTRIVHTERVQIPPDPAAQEP